ncbi:MAG TPA: fused MFS/spermidine synthase [Phycicoccus sp.]|nr:fused MFS/spermidine synthase [Phycicoccus sp.]
MSDSDRPGEIIPDGHAGAIVMSGGQPQSHVNLADPEDLGFEYIALMATTIETHAVQHGAPRTITHVGGAGLSLPRWVQHRWPGAPQIVLEPDAALTDLVRQNLPLPRGHRIRVRPVDGRAGMRALADRSAAVVVMDAYAGGRVPADLTTDAWWADVARVLVPDGVLLANLADEPGRTWTSRVIAGVVASGLTEVDLIGTHDILKGRRFGNLVMVARRPEVLESDELARALTRASLPAGVRSVTTTAGGTSKPGQRTAYATPFTDEDAQPSPEPPALGRWRAR